MRFPNGDDYHQLVFTVSIYCVSFVTEYGTRKCFTCKGVVRCMLRSSYLDREYEALSTVNHCTVKWQCNSHTNSPTHNVLSSYLGHAWKVKKE